MNHEPIFTIGPDWKMSLFELFLTNFVMFMVLRQTRHVKYVWTISMVVLALKNFCFLLTCLVNPGMIPRNPHIHNIEYLKHVAKYNQMENICTKCNLVKPYTNVVHTGKRKVTFLGKRRTQSLGTPQSRQIFHCCACDVCYIGRDHHCMWCGKCIAGGNLHLFYAFLTMLSVMLVFFWVNLIIGGI